MKNSLNLNYEDNYIRSVLDNTKTIANRSEIHSDYRSSIIPKGANIIDNSNSFSLTIKQLDKIFIKIN